MTSIPVTLNPRTSLIFEYAWGASLSMEMLSQWANRLLEQGICTDSIVHAALNPDAASTKVLPNLLAICRELEIETNSGWSHLREQATLEEYVNGHFSPEYVLWACNDFRKTTGFSEQLELRTTLEKNGDESHAFRGLDSGISGEELLEACKRHLLANGVVRSTTPSE